MRTKRTAKLVAVVLFLTGSVWAQDSSQRPAAAAGRAAEAPVDGLVRKDVYSVALTVPGKVVGPGVDAGPELVVKNFEFNGDAVTTDKLHFKQLGPGVVEIASVAYSVGNWRFRVRDAANYYGLGERFDTLNHAHTVVMNSSQDNGRAKGSSTYKPIPFFMSTTGYGLWVDTTAEATFDMNATNNAEIIVDVAAEKLRIVLFTGPEFPAILEHFTGLAGRAILPPYWAFAPWKARDFHQNDAQVKEDVDKNRQLGLPASVILIDSPWSTSYNSYIFNPKQFDDAPGTIKYVHDQGYKLVLWHTSWINSKSNPPGEAGFAGKIAATAENYDEAAGNGFFVKNPDGTPYLGQWWKGTGSLIDFTNPRAKQWWQDQVRKAIQAGADGFKDDDAEGNFLGAVKFSDGSDVRVMRNKYAVLYNNAMEELIQKDLKGNGVLFARSVTVGANGIGMLWGGDNEASFSVDNGLPTVVTAGLGSGLSGMPLWTADLGGYEKTASTPDPVLFQRWTEYAAFSPVMEVMSQANLGPWDYDQKTGDQKTGDQKTGDQKAGDQKAGDQKAGDQKAGGDQALTTYRKYAVLHMSLFPYRYAAAQEAAKTGMPLMRALVLQNQNDERARTIKDEYMLGPDFLVAPVVDEGTQRAVYLPKGEWVDYWTGAPVSGGKTVVVDAPVDKLPLYVRSGAVIAKIPEDVMTLVPRSESGNSQVKTLDDRRVYEVYGAGDTAVTDFEGRVVKRGGSSLTITGDAAARVTVRWRFGAVKSVTVNGAAAKVQTGDGGAFVEFDHAKSSAVNWQ